MSVVPQLAHLRSTSSAGDSIVDHRAFLMMKDAEPQVWQAKPFCSITWRRHCARSPEGYIPADYMLLHFGDREDVRRSSSNKLPFHALRCIAISLRCSGLIYTLLTRAMGPAFRASS
jgi:hypothetical protein